LSKTASFANSPVPEFFFSDGEERRVAAALQIGDRPVVEQSSLEQRVAERVFGRTSSGALWAVVH